MTRRTAPMMLWPRLCRRPDPVVCGIVATCCAAAFVLYLGHRAATGLQRQTDIVVQQMAQDTAEAVADELRATLEGPVFNTLTAVNHPQIQDNRLDLLKAEFRTGLADYPQVERFFAWTEGTEALVPGEAIFYGARDDEEPGPSLPRGIPEGFHREPELGRQIVRLARKAAPSQQIYAAYELEDDDVSHAAFLRLFWVDARRDRYFAVTGFIVDQDRVRNALIPELVGRRLNRLLTEREDGLPFELRVIDEYGETVWGREDSSDRAVRVAVPMVFYPAQTIGSRLAANVNAVSWTIEVGPARTNALAQIGSEGYWLAALSVALMLVALVFTVKSVRRASEMARMQADFVSHVSHELKTPLSLLSAATETLALDRVRSPEKLAQYASMIRNDVARLSALVQRILEFSRVQQARPLAFEEVDLAPLVRETVEAFEHSLAGQDFAFRVVREGESPRVIADPAAIEQVLANLLDNAVKYSAAVKTVTVRIFWSGYSAIVEVSDHGVGIPAAERGRIFEKFYRGAGAASRSQGFGLGLTIVQQLVTAHGGRLEVESAPDQGSTFRVVLPAVARLRRSASKPVPEVSA